MTVILLLNSPGNIPTTIKVPWVFAADPYIDLEVRSGDTIIFEYGSGHDVRKFENKDAYDQCDFDGRLISEAGVFTGPTSFLVEDDAGSVIYVGCSFDGHCEFGNQKLVIYVV